MKNENKLSPLLVFLTLGPLSMLRKETLYRIYTRELDRELCTGLFTLYTKTP